MNTNNTVKCPNCKEVFKVDDSVYTDIVKQVRDQQFQDELNNRLETANREKQSALQLKEAELKHTFQELLAQKQREIEDLKHKSKSELVEEVSKKDRLIQELQSKIDKSETEKKLELQQAVSALEKQKDQLANDIKLKEAEKENLEKSLKEEFRLEKDHIAKTLQLKDEEIERLKDYKQKLSTKMLGETLEQHCETTFNQLRATAFPNAYFEKDNDASNGTKAIIFTGKPTKTAMRSYRLCSR